MQAFFPIGKVHPRQSIYSTNLLISERINFIFTEMTRRLLSKETKPPINGIGPEIIKKTNQPN
jgi:hypothetical protein